MKARQSKLAKQVFKNRKTARKILGAINGESQNYCVETENGKININIKQL